MEELEFGNLTYVPHKSGNITGIEIRKYRGNDEAVDIPHIIDGKPVISIGRKSFLSCKSVRVIVLPDSVCEIGDWAFAHAENLRKVVIPRQEVTRGKELFLGCKRLRAVELNPYPDEYADKGLDRMLALGVTVLHDYFLLDALAVGSDEWMSRFDEKLISLIGLDDLDGFEELWTCGEEDYEGKDYDIKSYPVEKRKMKLRIVYFRLLNPFKITGDTKLRLQNYIRDSKESWEIIMEEHRDELDYYKVFTDSGAATWENFEQLITDMVNVPPEIKAYMLRYKDENLRKADVFSDFDLNW